MKKVNIYTDGACSCNPGPGGYGVILDYKGKIKEISGGNKNTTNNRMELTAIIVGLKALKEPCRVALYTDSKYCIDCFKNGWAEKWQKNNWKRDKKNTACNSDLLEEALNLLKVHNVEFVWVKGHNGHPQNERCDTIAKTWIKTNANGGNDEKQP